MDQTLSSRNGKSSYISTYSRRANEMSSFEKLLITFMQATSTTKIYFEIKLYNAKN
jgi:hypothetical protein